MTEASKGVAQFRRGNRRPLCYTTAISAAALGHLGAAHKRGSGTKTARSREEFRKLSAVCRRRNWRNVRSRDMNSLQITARPGWAASSSEIDQRKGGAHPRPSRGRSASPTRLDASQAGEESSNARIGEQGESVNGTPIVLVNNFKPATRTVRYPVDIVNSIRQIRDRSAAPCGA